MQNPQYCLSDIDHYRVAGTGMELSVYVGKAQACAFLRHKCLVLLLMSLLNCATVVRANVNRSLKHLLAPQELHSYFVTQAPGLAILLYTVGLDLTSFI